VNYLIVVPLYKSRVGDFYDFPLGLAYISAVLKQNGVNVSVLNLNQVGGTLDKLLADRIEHDNIDVLCTGGLCVHYLKIKEILTLAKTIKPEIITIVGGGLISSEPQLMAENLAMDFGVIGEGDVTIAELSQSLGAKADPAGVKGLIFNRDGQIVKTPERDPIDDLASIPFPDYDGFGVEAYLDNQYPSDGYYMHPYDHPRILPIISSRSCPYNCTFCFHPLGRKYRRRPLDNFFNEVEFLIDKYRLNLLAVLDETLAASKGRVKEFCQRIKSFNIKWMTQLRITAVDDEILAMLKDAGCYYISYGIESASNKILKSMKKFITIEDIEKGLALTQKHQIGIQGNFLIGDREETFDDVCKTIDWWLAHPNYHLNVNTLVPYPGSEAYQYCIEQGLIQDRLNYIETGCNVVNMTRMPKEQFAKVYSFLYEIRTNLKYFQPVDIFSGEKVGSSSIRKTDLVGFTFKCSQCGAVNSYRNFIIEPSVLIKLACRHCNQRSDIRFDKVFAFKTDTDRSFPPKNFQSTNS
jgi:anaerobic magnesium-protoporphyrin IX monomethyl ester cyclase